jgi:hypothetical protein
MSSRQRWCTRRAGSIASPNINQRSAGAERMVHPERRHHVGALDVALEQTGELREDLARARMQPRLIGRH